MGDFDRPQPSTVNDEIMPFAGKLAARHRGEPTSFYRYTDAEQELRNRSWSLLMPTLPQQYFERWVAEMRRTRLMSPAETVPDRADYVEHLLSEDYSSSSARYLKLMTDIDANRYQIREFISVANRVAVDDRVRERALEWASNVTPRRSDRTRSAGSGRTGSSSGSSRKRSATRPRCIATRSNGC